MRPSLRSLIGLAEAHNMELAIHIRSKRAKHERQIIDAPEDRQDG